MKKLTATLAAILFALSYLRDRDEAQDAVQEVFVRLWKTADRFDPKRAALVTWVMLISRRHLVDRLRDPGDALHPVIDVG